MEFDVNQPAHVKLRAIVSERTNPLVAWIGAGLSRAAGLPSWKGLRKNLCGLLEDKITNGDPGEAELLGAKLALAEREPNLWKAMGLLKEALGLTTFTKGVRNTLSPADTCPIPADYALLWRLPLQAMLNLNLDRLASRAFSNAYPGRGMVSFDGHSAKDHIHVLKTRTASIAYLHGSSDDRSSWVLTEADLKALFATPGYSELINSCILGRTLLFVGITADDIAAGGHLHSLRARGIDFGDHFWLTHRTDEATLTWADEAGLQIIHYPATQTDHRALRMALDDLLGDVSRDDEPPPVKAVSLALGTPDLPEPEDLELTPRKEAREILNYHASVILEPGTAEAYAEYEAFCDKFDAAIYDAWYVPTRPPHGELFGYALKRAIGHGAFGRVFRAISPEGDVVAVKLLRQDIRQRQDMLQSFRRGVRAMGILSRNSIAGMVPYRAACEIPAFVVMDWVDGPNLKDAVDSGQCSEWSQILKIAGDLTSIVRSAHRLSERVLHRDLRPPNIMLRGFFGRPDDWELVVLDFDLSWYKGSVEMSLVSQNAMHGYIAPEQVTKREKESTRSAAVDSFGLAMTLFFLCSGRDPGFLEHRATNWQNTVMSAVNLPGCDRWRSLPQRYARLILSGTRDAQAERCDVAQIEGELALLKEAYEAPHKVLSAELLAEELSCRALAEVGGAAGYSWDADKLAGKVVLPGGGALTLLANEAEGTLVASFKWESGGGHSRKKVGKYLSTTCQNAIAMLKAAGWTAIGQPTMTSKSCYFGLEKEVVAVAPSLDRSATALGKAMGLLQFD